MTRLPRYLGSILGLAALMPFSAFALTHESTKQPKNPKIASDVVVRSFSDQTVHVIIQYKQDPSQTEQDLVDRLRGKGKKSLSFINAIAAQVPASSLDQIASDPNVAYISKDHPVAARQVSITKAEFTTEPINAPQVWSKGFNGTGIGVAVIDSGINPVDDLSALVTVGKGKDATLVPLGTRVVYSQSFLPLPYDATDQFGHGTHVAGLIAGNGTDSTGPAFYRTFSGSAPNANLINLRVLDENGNGTDSAVIAAIQTAISLQSTYNIRVINLSLGRPIWESYAKDPLCQAVEQAWKAGIVVVVAAGNDGRDLAFNAEGYGTVEAPGNDPYVLTVGAMRTMGTATTADDLIASYSSKGPSFIDHISKPDLVAPGNLVSSLKYPFDSLAVNNPSFVTRDSFYITNGDSQPSPAYFPLSGTSMATGVASGAVADLLQAQPKLTPDQVKAILMYTANKNTFPATSSVTDPASGTVYKAIYDVFTIGAGYLDIGNALKVATSKGFKVPAGTAMSPVATYNAGTGATTLVTDQTVLWGATILWGASNVYGANAFTPEVGSSTILWGATALAGANDPAGFTELWGSTILWGASTPEAATILWGADNPSSTTILWGASGPSSSTILWGADAPYEF